MLLRFNEQCNPKQISLTGVRALVILALLCKKPRTFKEIKEFLISSNLVDRQYSIDTIRIDLNTLKYVGCEITRADKKTNNCYVLISHPFELAFTKEQINAIDRVYKSICKNLSVERLLDFDNLFEKIAKIIPEQTEKDKKEKKPDLKEMMRGISILKNVDKDIVKDILHESYKNGRIIISYVVDTKERQYDVTIDNLGVRSGKLYLYCFNHTMKKRTFLKFSSIKSIVSKISNDDNIKSKDYTVEFSLNNYKNYELEDKETILKENGKCATIKGNYFSDFIARQRMLYFADDCTIIEPAEMKEKVLEQLIGMRGLYE